MPPDSPNPSPAQEVRRFEPVVHPVTPVVGEPYQVPGLRPSESGEAVLFADHQRLLQAAEKERDDWREEAWQCYQASGADPDGADARHLNPGEAKAAVWQCRQDERECWDESDRLRNRAQAAESKLSSVAEEVEKRMVPGLHPLAGNELLGVLSLLRDKGTERGEPCDHCNGTGLRTPTQQQDNHQLDKGPQGEGKS